MDLAVCNGALIFPADSVQPSSLSHTNLAGLWPSPNPSLGSSLAPPLYWSCDSSVAIYLHTSIMDAPMTFRRLRASQSRYKIYKNVSDVMTLYHKSPCHPIATLYQKIYIQVATLYYPAHTCAARGSDCSQPLYNMLSAKQSLEILTFRERSSSSNWMPSSMLSKSPRDLHKSKKAPIISK